jgi:hypothetical protein
MLEPRSEKIKAQNMKNVTNISINKLEAKAINNHA